LDISKPVICRTIIIMMMLMLIIIIIIIITSFVKDLGHRISQRSSDARETQFLFQRLSVILQRFNAVFGESFLAAPDDPDM